MTLEQMIHEQVGFVWDWRIAWPAEYEEEPIAVILVQRDATSEWESAGSFKVNLSREDAG